MNQTLSAALERAPIEDLEALIDELDLPYAENDRLRAMFHAARREPNGRAKTELAQALAGHLRTSPRSRGFEVAVAFLTEVAAEVVTRMAGAAVAPQRRRRHRHGR